MKNRKKCFHSTIFQKNQKPIKKICYKVFPLIDILDDILQNNLASNSKNIRLIFLKNPIAFVPCERAFVKYRQLTCEWPTLSYTKNVF